MEPRQAPVRGGAREGAGRQACSIFQNVHGEDHWTLAYCRSLYGAFLVKMARYDEAEGMLLTSRAALDQALGRENDRTQKTYRHLVELYEA